MNIIDDIKNIDLRDFDPKSMDLKDRRTQVMLLTVIVVLASAVLYLYFIFVPQVIRVYEHSVDIGKMKSELKSAHSVITGFEKLKNGLKEDSQKVESYEKKLPAEQEIPALLENLSKMAKDSNIKIVSIVPAISYFKDDKPANNGLIYREIPILITARSGYHELGHFLSNLENADRFMKVVDINIKANKLSPREHDVELMVCTYILLPENK